MPHPPKSGYSGTKQVLYCTVLHMRRVVWHLHYVLFMLYCARVEWYGTCMTFVRYILDGTVCMVIRSCLWSNG